VPEILISVIHVIRVLTLLALLLLNHDLKLQMWIVPLDAQPETSVKESELWKMVGMSLPSIETLKNVWSLLIRFALMKAEV